MKKFVKGLLLATFAVAMIGCKASTDDGSDGYSDPTDISFDGKTFKLTASVQLMTKAATIKGSDDYNHQDTGAFPKGRTVTLSPFIMGKYEVTQELYEAVMTGQKVKIGGEDKDLSPNPSWCTSTSSDYKNMLPGEEQKYRPVEGVTWYDACYFCNVLSEKMGLTKAYTITNISVSEGHITSATVTPVTGSNGYRLPTEAEWEYAARGGAAGVTNGTFANYWSGATTTNYSKLENEDLDNAGWYWYNISSGKTSSSNPSSGTAGYGTHHGTHQVGKKPSANAAGLCDMSGNVREWCYDRYDTIDTTETVTDPSGASGAQSDRVIRGGSWSNFAGDCAVSRRINGGPDGRGYNLGFRVVRNAE